MSYLYQFKIIMIGDSGVGKSSMVHRFVNNKFIDLTDITIGVDFGVRIIDINNVPIKLHIWDTAGQEQFRSITRQYFKDAAGVILCYDVTYRKSFENIVKWLDAVKEETANCVIKLVGTKCDLDNKRTVGIMEARRYAQENNMLFEEVSSKKSNENIDKCFTGLAAEIYKAIQTGKINIDEKAIKTGLYVDKRDLVDTSKITNEKEEVLLREGSGKQKKCCA
jgi:Ras-related protein Rab-2A